MGCYNGIDTLRGEDAPFLRGRRLGLITGPTGLTAGLESSIDLLRGRYRLTALFAPEHGVRGDAEAGTAVASSRDERTGLPVFSLYGAAGTRPSREALDSLDCLLIDIQDVGSRFYTFISTMYQAMEECARWGKTFVVLDRVNPLGGLAVEGNLVEPDYMSFVGVAALPQRHGMTMGELARFFNRECGIGCDLQVVPVRGWRRGLYGDETGLPWVNPSPNIPSVDAALVYSGSCLLEGTNLSEGRGTTRPFEVAGAPWLDAEALAGALNREGLPGARFRPVYFTPWTSKYAGELCRGVQTHVTDRGTFRPVRTALRLLEAARDQAGERFAWLPPGEAGRWRVDLLAGSDALRLGRREDYRGACAAGEAAFGEQRRPYLLY